MANKCASSLNLALHAVLRNVMRSQLTSIFSASSIIPHHGQFNSRSSLYPRNSQPRRPFSLSSCLRWSENEQTKHAAPETKGFTDAATSPRSFRNGFKPPGNKKGWTSHKYQPKNQERDPDRKPGWTDRERRIFRNEKRREAKSNPNRDQGETKARQSFEKPKNGKPEDWQVQKAALKQKFEHGWNPPKKLSPDALDGIRHLHAKAPERFTTAVLAEEFEMSPEAIRRILKSKWRPSEEEMENRRRRWENRHDRIWSRMAELGLRPSNEKTKKLADYHVLYKDDGHKSS